MIFLKFFFPLPFFSFLNIFFLFNVKRHGQIVDWRYINILLLLLLLLLLLNYPDENVIKQLLHASTMRSSRYEALGKFGERSRS